MKSKIAKDKPRWAALIRGHPMIGCGGAHGWRAGKTLNKPCDKTNCLAMPCIAIRKNYGPAVEDPASWRRA